MKTSRNIRLRNKAPINLDRIDRALLLALQADARLTVAALAERAHLSTSSTWRRIKRMEDEGVISGYRAVLDQRAVGWGVLAFVMVTIEDYSEEQARAFEKPIFAMLEIIACWSIAGSADFLLQVVAQDLDSYSDFAMQRV